MYIMYVLCMYVNRKLSLNYFITIILNFYLNVVYKINNEVN